MSETLRVAYATWPTGSAADDTAAMVRAFNDQGIDAEVWPVGGGEWQNLEHIPLVLQVAGGIGFGELCKLFFDDLYAAWFRPLLDSTIFRERSATGRDALLALDGRDVKATLLLDDAADLDVATRDLRVILQHLQDVDSAGFDPSEVQSLTYRASAWLIHTTKSTYAYNRSTEHFDRLPEPRRHQQESECP